MNQNRRSISKRNRNQIEEDSDGNVYRQESILSGSFAKGGFRKSANNSPLKMSSAIKGKIEPNSPSKNAVEMQAHDIFLGEQMLRMKASNILGTEVMINNMLP